MHRAGGERPTFELGDDEIEMGVGIHGEAGRERMKMKQASEIVDMMATAIVDDLPFGKGDQVLVRERHGRHTMIELYVVYNEHNKFLSGRDVSRNLIGSYITSSRWPGVSSLLS